MKIAVVISDATGLINAGLDVERVVRTFEMPAEMKEWVQERAKNTYTSVSFALVDERD